MQTIKTAVVVVLLLFVLYGGYIALNHSEPPLRQELENLVDPDMLSADVDVPSDGFAPPPLTNAGASPASGGSPADAFAKFASGPAPNFGSSAGSASNSDSSSSGLPEVKGLPDMKEIPELEVPVPTIPSLELPSVQVPGSAEGGLNNSPSGSIPKPDSASLLPKNTDSGVALASASGTREPGFGLSLPNRNSQSRTAPSNLPPVPPLDLPSLHGEAKSMADATAPRDSMNPRNSYSSNDDLGASDEQHASPSPRMPTSSSGKSYENAKRLAMEQVEAGKLKEALAMLSVFYNAQDLPQDQHTDLVDLLDALAREVVYSRRHLLDMPYVVAPGETLEQIAKTCNVPVDVLARINGLDPNTIPPAGLKVKVIPGPFRAEIDLNTNEMTMFLGELYAGRYPATFGSEPEPRPGVYQILDKQRNRNYYASNGMQISANDPKNPFGGYWLDLGQDLCIHGSPEVETGANHMGCISLSPLDAADVFGMLGRGSQVTIRK